MIEIKEKKLKTLAEFNAEKQRQFDAVKKMLAFAARNGIECPNCKAELVDAGIVLLSVPIKNHVKCLECGFKGTRLK